MSQAIIRAGFESRLSTWAAAQTPAIPVAWQNVAFTPPVGRYLRAFLLPAKTQTASMDGICRTWKGIFQVSFCMPIGTGSGTVEGLAASMGAAFTDSFTQSGLRIYLLEPFSMAAAIQEPDRYVVPMSASYRVDTVA
ncbi:hypothetical protein J7E62_27735 [Variovorax paradoxus]|nr:hypothetical protein [Variovorax paradoxus]